MCFFFIMVYFKTLSIHLMLLLISVKSVYGFSVFSLIMYPIKMNTGVILYSVGL